MFDRCSKLDCRRLLVPVTALVVGVAFVAMDVVRNNYGGPHALALGLECLVGLVSALVADRLRELDRRGEERLSRDFQLSDERAIRIERAVLAATRFALVMTPCLSILNVAVITPLVYRATVDGVVLTTIARLLADLPACWFICLLLQLFWGWRFPADGRSRER